MRPSSPRSSRISSTTARYSRASSLGVLVVGVAVVDLLHVDAQGVAIVLAGDGGAGEAAVQAEHGRDRVAAARAAALDHLGDDADAAELAVAAGEQEDALLLADVDRQGRGDGGEDDRLVERESGDRPCLSPISVVSPSTG